MFNPDTLRSLFNWFNALPGIAKTILSFFVMFTAPLAFVAWFMVTRVARVDPEFKTEVITRFDQLQHQIAAAHLAAQNNWHRQFAFNDSVMIEISVVNGEIENIKCNMSDMTLIIAANSPSEVLKLLSPYLKGIKEDTYTTVLWIQKQEVLKRLEDVKAGYRKVKKP